MHFICDKCQCVYDTFAKAERCETMKPKGLPAFQVGDIVTYRAGFGWYDGDRRWISNPDVDPARPTCPHNCFDVCCTWSFYYVITAIETDHDAYLYHLMTGAMQGPDGYSTGQAIFDSSLKKVQDPPAFVVEDSKRFIGMRVPGHRSTGPRFEERC